MEFNQDKINTNPQLHIVTVATEIKYYMPYLIESCKKNGYELEILGLNKKWTGFMFKLLHIIEYLKTLNANDIVCLIDGYDVICCRDLNELKKEFIELQKTHKCKIIVSSETGIFTLTFRKLYFDTCKQHPINAGVYIGYVSDLLDIIQKVYNLYLQNKQNDDQILLTKQCNINPNDFYIDVDNKLFLSILTPLLDLNNSVDIKNKELIYNNNKPFFIHAPGFGILDNVIINLGYKYDSNVKTQYYKSIYKQKCMLYFNAIFDNPTKQCILFIFICVIFYFIHSYVKRSIIK